MKTNDIIELLQRGEKYEAMWGELKIEYTDQWDISHIPISMKEIEQKYFPKLKTELIKLVEKLNKLVKEILEEM